VEAHEAEVFAALDGMLRATEGVQVLGSAKARLGAVSFTVDGAHPSDIGAFLDQAGVALTSRFLKRKMEEYDALKVEIETLKAKVGEDEANGLGKASQ
jgi:selenocysteine lyase/cysteine desulfurase